MTFSKSWTLADLPPYQHTDPGPAFMKLSTRSSANCSTP
jgi:type VI secretion system protein ImpJ